MPSRPPERIETTRLLLRQSREEDAEAIYHGYARDADVTRFLLWPPHTNIQETQGFLQHCRDVWEEGTAFPYAIVNKEDGSMMGMIEMRIDGHRADFGYVLAKPRWGNGYVPEALAALVNWASSQSDIHRVWAYCDVENRASQRVLEKVGMEREGLLRHYAMMPNVADIPRDCYSYSIP